MNMFSLSTLIDDILLIVRNNNISESEDLSRAQIAAWILHYKAALEKAERDKNEQEGGDDYIDERKTRTIGPLQLEVVKSLDNNNLFTRKTKEKLQDLYEEDPKYIISVFDQQGRVIQSMNNLRRHYHYFRKYTSRDLTYFYANGYVMIQGNVDCMHLANIWIKYVSKDLDADKDEDSIEIPDWMVPQIKEGIFKNELAFMIKMPSDDDNNSTLDGIKPHGPQDQEK